MRIAAENMFLVVGIELTYCSVAYGCYAPPLIGGGIKRCFCLTSVVCLSRTSGITREQRPRKTKIGTQVAHVTRDSDTTFKVKRSKVNLQGRGNIVTDSRTSLIIFIKSCRRGCHCWVLFLQFYASLIAICM